MPEPIMAIMAPFAPVFRSKTWEKVQMMAVGAILAPGKRTVSAILRVMGLSANGGFANYHHVLSRAMWAPLQLSRILLGLLLAYLDKGQGALVFGIDETIERRWGRRIKARGIYRDAVRSSESHFVKASGLRWISLMWLTPIHWAQRIWALPFLTVLAPSGRYYASSARRQKTLIDWARQMILQLRRWLPAREVVVVGDSNYAALDLLHTCQALPIPVTMVTRLRMDAALYDPAPPYSGIGRPRKKGKRLPTLQHCLDDPNTIWQTVTLTWYDGQQRVMELASGPAVWYHNGKSPVLIRWVLIRDPQGEYDPVAVLCTNPAYTPVQIVGWFVSRWQVEVTLEEVRAHLGVETQRQWSDKAIARTTPALLGLFSWVTLAAHVLQDTHLLTIRQAAWYAKPLPTFSDAIAFVRFHLWPHSSTFCMSPPDPEVVKIPRALLDRLVDTLCYAA
jgi:hypothetical protein